MAAVLSVIVIGEAEFINTSIRDCKVRLRLEESSQAYKFYRLSVSLLLSAQ